MKYIDWVIIFTIINFIALLLAKIAPYFYNRNEIIDGITFLGVILIGGYILWFLLKSCEEGGKKNEDENKERNSKNGRIREKKKKVKMKRSIREVIVIYFGKLFYQ